MKVAFEGGRHGFSLELGRLDIIARAEPTWPREWSFCREPGSVEFQVGRRVLTVCWGAYQEVGEVRWSAPFPWPWASPSGETGK